MKVAILKEAAPGETRVAMVPAVLGDLRKAGFEVAVGAFCERPLTPRNLLIQARR